MNSTLKKYCNVLIAEFDTIAPERKDLLGKLANYITGKCDAGKEANLVYICTHNSRRSHFGQVWAHVAAKYYGIAVRTFSGGTEVTAFHPHAIAALRRAGFAVEKFSGGSNPHYRLFFDAAEKPVECFSKTYDDPENPQQNFAAVMTCSEAETNCPFVGGAEIRISTTYDDPKEFDHTPLQDRKYDERCRQIALESLYVFSKVKKAKPATASTE